jgi:hypothetical protein
MVLINSGGAPGTGMGSMPEAPPAKEENVPTKPTVADNSKTGQKSCK